MAGEVGSSSIAGIVADNTKSIVYWLLELPVTAVFFD